MFLYSYFIFPPGRLRTALLRSALLTQERCWPTVAQPTSSQLTRGAGRSTTSRQPTIQFSGRKWWKYFTRGKVQRVYEGVQYYHSYCHYIVMSTIRRHLRGAVLPQLLSIVMHIISRHMKGVQLCHCYCQWWSMSSVATWRGTALPLLRQWWCMSSVATWEIVRELINICMFSVHTKDSGVREFHISHRPAQMIKQSGIKA